MFGTLGRMEAPEVLPSLVGGEKNGRLCKMEQWDSYCRGPAMPE